MKGKINTMRIKQLNKIQNTNESIRANYENFNVFLLSEKTKEQLEELKV